MHIFTASRLATVTGSSAAGSVIAGGGVAVEGTRITEVGTLDELRSHSPGAAVTDFGDALLAPGMVNAHVHLQYSHFGPMTESKDFLLWIVDLVRRRSALDDAGWLASVGEGIRMLHRYGVTCIGDIATDDWSLEAFASGKIHGVFFAEGSGMESEDLARRIAEEEERIDRAAARLRSVEGATAGVAPHSPYTVGSRALEALAGFATERGLPLSVHAAEHPAEIELVAHGGGQIAPFVEQFVGEDLIETGGSGVSSVAWLDRHGVWEAEHAVAVHCVHAGPDDLAFLAEKKVAIACCPRSNQLLKCGESPVRAGLDAGAETVLGTDSLASNQDLSILNEAREARRAGGLSGGALLEQLTLGAARALGLDAELGSIETGKLADFCVLAGEEDELTGLPAQNVATVLAGEIVFEEER